MGIFLVFAASPAFSAQERIEYADYFCQEILEGFDPDLPVKRVDVDAHLASLQNAIQLKGVSAPMRIEVFNRLLLLSRKQGQHEKAYAILDRLLSGYSHELAENRPDDVGLVIEEGGLSASALFGLKSMGLRPGPHDHGFHAIVTDARISQKIIELLQAGQLREALDRWDLAWIKIRVFDKNFSIVPAEAEVEEQGGARSKALSRKATVVSIQPGLHFRVSDAAERELGAGFVTEEREAALVIRLEFAPLALAKLKAMSGLNIKAVFLNDPGGVAGALLSILGFHENIADPEEGYWVYKPQPPLSAHQKEVLQKIFETIVAAEREHLVVPPKDSMLLGKTRKTVKMNDEKQGFGVKTVLSREQWREYLDSGRLLMGEEIWSYELYEGLALPTPVVDLMNHFSSRLGPPLVNLANLEKDPKALGRSKRKR